MSERQGGKYTRSREYWSNTQGGRTHKLLYPDGLMQGAPPGIVEVVFDPPMLMMGKGQRLGEAVTSSGSATYVIGGQLYMAASYTCTARAVRFEDVLVPAGTFHTLRLEVTMGMYANPFGTPVSSTETAQIWTAPNIGPVKEAYALDGAPAREGVLLATNLPLGPAFPDARANGEPEILAVTPEEGVTIALGLDPGTYLAKVCDWYVVLATPAGPFSLTRHGWQRGVIRLGQLGLLPFTDLPILETTLPAGSYTLYFALRGHQTWTDTVEIRVEPVPQQ
ncbi:MAG: hypothetical protein AB1634_06055 [Thermodesulfobacteriota bacterium]